MKYSAKVLCVFLSILSIAVLTGCNKNDDDNPTAAKSSAFVGTWTLTKISVKVASATVDLTPAQANFQMTIAAKSDNTYQATMINSGSTTQQSGTWSYDETTSTVTFKLSDGTTQTMKIKFNDDKSKLYVDQTMDTVLGANTPVTLEFSKQ